ncbi:MAG: GNAT family N-acetyltransferase [Caldilineales bacterium]
MSYAPPVEVSLTTDKREIYAFLQRDPVYAAYAIGDLEPEMFADCTWFLAGRGASASALALVYRGLEPTVLLTMGDPDAVADVLSAIRLPDQAYMVAQCRHRRVFERFYDFSGDRVRPMVRMTVSSDAFRPSQSRLKEGRLRRLEPDDMPAIEMLYGHGGPHTPDAFHPRQMHDGAFFGVFAPESDDLLAVAGTHLIAPNWGVGAVGNIYTHPAWRRRGLASLLTSAVTAELLQRGLLVVLNVDQANAAAIRIYESLGYRTHCPYIEGIGKLVDW